MTFFIWNNCRMTKSVYKLSLLQILRWGGTSGKIRKHLKEYRFACNDHLRKSRRTSTIWFRNLYVWLRNLYVIMIHESLCKDGNIPPCRFGQLLENTILKREIIAEICAVSQYVPRYVRNCSETVMLVLTKESSLGHGSFIMNKVQKSIVQPQRSFPEM